MAPIGMERKGYAAKKSTMAAVAVFVALAAVPVLADTVRDRVVSRLSSATSTGGGQNTPAKGAVEVGTTASVLMSRAQEQGDYPEKVIRRLASETSLTAGSISAVEKGLQPALSSLQVSLDLEDYRQMVRTRLHGH